jgi:hypothetical protein
LQPRFWARRFWLKQCWWHQKIHHLGWPSRGGWPSWDAEGRIGKSWSRRSLTKSKPRVTIWADAFISQSGGEARIWNLKKNWHLITGRTILMLNRIFETWGRKEVPDPEGIEFENKLEDWTPEEELGLEVVITMCSARLERKPASPS